MLLSTWDKKGLWAREVAVASRAISFVSCSVMQRRWASLGLGIPHPTHNSAWGRGLRDRADLQPNFGRCWPVRRSMGACVEAANRVTERITSNDMRDRDGERRNWRCDQSNHEQDRQLTKKMLGACERQAQIEAGGPDHRYLRLGIIRSSTGWVLLFALVTYAPPYSKLNLRQGS